MRKYIPSEVEPKWQKKWEAEKIYATPDKSDKPKKYVLDMFPYPSGASMHVGHLEGYVGTDIISRFERMKGNSVLHPMGWDAFGLPAENYAIKTGIHPNKSIPENIKTFKRQLNITGLSYDWNREIDTSSPEFYKWTEWLFILMFKRGLAYKKEADVNWCPSCQTVLANEQVVEARLPATSATGDVGQGKCDRCSTEVIKKKLDQWFLKITDYADRLISGLDKIDWLEEVKIQQKNWIGKSEGVMLRFKVKDMDIHFEMFDSVPQTFMAQTFTVIAPEHPKVYELVKGTEYEKPVMEFVEKIKRKKASKKFDIEKETEGIFTSRYLEYKVAKRLLPIWVASFVIAEYGTGVVNSSAHDERDFVFAKKYELPLHPVMFPQDPELAKKVINLEVCYHHAEDGILEEPVEFKGRKWGEVREDVINYIEKNGYGKKSAQYHLRDWLISRQRYWGAPIPMIYCKKCNWQPVAEKDLPVELPEDVDFRPTGESPIARSKSFQEGVKCPNCGGEAKREIDTMDSYVDSSWYFIRFVDPKNDKEFAGSQAIKDWLPVDSYVGGGHVVQHLLFARFFWKVLFDAGLIDKSLGDEPFLKLRAPGWILGPDSRKMSKRWSNVVTPDDVIPEYGADAMRLYEMFLGPFEVMKPWSLTGVEGVYRFLQRVWSLFDKVSNTSKVGFDSFEVDDQRIMHKTIKKVTGDIEGIKFNTAIAALMEWLNYLSKKEKISKEEYQTFLLLLAPFAPHITEELYQNVILEGAERPIGSKDSIASPSATLQNDKNGSIHKEPWPKFDPKYLEEEEISIVVQVNGKVRDILMIQKDIENHEKDIEKLATMSPKIQKYIDGKSVKKVVYIPGKIINLVVGPD